ncbi:MAG: L-2-hydroxyglutarate oxidase [Opitutales bacterium]
MKRDVCIIGGGIVGLATAYRLAETHPEKKILILEKETRVAVHQTGHNSGVLHSGIYYKPGSLKAINCREGKKAMEAFCEKEDIDHDICGKVIVAVSEDEVGRMKNIHERGQANGVNCELISKERLAELEPHAVGVGAIHVPEAGIVNYRQVCERLAQRVTEKEGNEIVREAKVTGIRKTSEGVVLQSSQGDFEASFLVNCAGLHSDRVTALGGERAPAKIIPFKGEYYELKPKAKTLCRNLIYPVPDPKFPFLGVHFTRMINGDVECGPNAVLAFGREAYGKLDLNLRDLLESLTYRGFIRMACKHWKMGLAEMWRSYNKGAFVKALQRLVPEIQAEHLESAPAGIRAQAVTPDGGLVDDFLIEDSERIVNVCNAPSPAATASLNVGKTVVNRLAERF